MKRKDLSGVIFGRLKVIGAASNYRLPSGKSVTMWNCQCECGKEITTMADSLLSERTKSCGCLNDDMRRARATHGCTRSTEFNTYHNMMRRCYDPKSDHFKYYGGRGIIVCERWRSSFKKFLEDMGYKPSQNHSIDRKDNNGNYEPVNCHWGILEEQANNKRNNFWIEIDGKQLTLPQWAKVVGIDSQLIRNRIWRGWGIKRAVMTPNPGRSAPWTKGVSV